MSVNSFEFHSCGAASHNICPNPKGPLLSGDMCTVRYSQSVSQCYMARVPVNPPQVQRPVYEPGAQGSPFKEPRSLFCTVLHAAAVHNRAPWLYRSWRSGQHRRLPGSQEHDKGLQICYRSPECTVRRCYWCANGTLSLAPGQGQELVNPGQWSWRTRMRCSITACCKRKPYQASTAAAMHTCMRKGSTNARVQPSQRFRPTCAAP